MKKFSNLKEFLKSKEFREKNISYCDLSNLNLSKLPKRTWNNFIFNHTDFSNTGIKFNPECLREINNTENYIWHYIYIIDMSYCNFTNCDLSYLRSNQFYNVLVNGCNFTNTNLFIIWENNFLYKDGKSKLALKEYDDVTFPVSKNLSSGNYKRILKFCDIRTIKNNPHIQFDSKIIFDKIDKMLPDNQIIFSNEELREYKEQILSLLEEDKKRTGKLYELFSIFNDDNPFTDFEFFCFFKKVIENKNYKCIDLRNIPIDLLYYFKFINCTFDVIYMPQNYYFTDLIYFAESHINKICIPKLSKLENPNKIPNRLDSTNVTFRTNLYLELYRICNGKCTFCRNKYLEECNYSIDNIKTNLIKLFNSMNIDEIFIGGGEPTLYMDDFESLIEQFTHYYYFTIVTNGTYKNIDELFYQNKFNIAISRHSVDDDINNEILGVRAYSQEELEEIGDFNERKDNTSFYATCFKGKGIDSVEKIIEYIKFANELKINKILFQNLHKDLNCDSSCLPIEDGIFDEVIKKLQEQKWDISTPIYSSGNYKLIIASKNDIIISFKKYISLRELENNWPFAIKRTIDLSMDPSGQVYNNWHQSSGKILLKEHK